MLDTLKEKESRFFVPELLNDTRFQLDKYQDQLSKPQFIKEALIQMLYLNTTLSLPDKQVAPCDDKIRRAHIGRECLVKHLSRRQRKAVDHYLDYLLDNGKAQED